jgi:hypothetical protein
MASIAGLELGSGDVTVSCVRALLRLVGRNVASEIGNASLAFWSVVHDCKPLPRGKSASLNDVSELVLVFWIDSAENGIDGGVALKKTLSSSVRAETHVCLCLR